MTAPARIMDAEHLEFADGAFSRVLCGFGMSSFPTWSCVARISPRPKRGGRIGVSTWQVSQAEDVRAVLDERGLGGPGEQGWITEPEPVADLLKHAGFTDVTVHVESHAFHYADLDKYLRAARATGERRRLEKLDADEAERVRSRLAPRAVRALRCSACSCGGASCDRGREPRRPLELKSPVRASRTIRA